MADLLSAGDRALRDAAISDLFDTFFKTNITLHYRAKRALSKFNNNRAGTSANVDYTLRALYVPDKKDDDAKEKQMPYGLFDDTEGEIFITWDDLKNNVPALIDANGKILIESNRDSFTIGGNEMDIIGINPVGPKEANAASSSVNFFLVKLQYKNAIRKNV